MISRKEPPVGWFSITLTFFPSFQILVCVYQSLELRATPVRYTEIRLALLWDWVEIKRDFTLITERVRFRSKEKKSHRKSTHLSSFLE